MVTNLTCHVYSVVSHRTNVYYYINDQRKRTIGTLASLRALRRSLVKQTYRVGNKMQQFILPSRKGVLNPQGGQGRQGSGNPGGRGAQAEHHLWKMHFQPDQRRSQPLNYVDRSRVGHGQLTSYSILLGVKPGEFRRISYERSDYRR